MTDAERAEILVTARLLEAASKIGWLSIGVTLLGLYSRKPAPVVIGVLALYYAVRIAFDAPLFADIGSGKLSADDLDAAFPAKAGRSWSARCRGARRLVVICASLTLTQIAVWSAAVLGG